MNKCKRMVAIICIFVMVMGVFNLNQNAYAALEEQRYYNIYKTDHRPTGTDNITITPDLFILDSNSELLLGQDTRGYENSDSVAYMPGKSELKLEVDVQSAGTYNILIDYYVPVSNVNDPIISIKVNGAYQFYESRNVPLYADWEDESKDYALDAFGNELPPTPVRLFRWNQMALNTKVYSFSRPLLFDLEQGRNEISIMNNALDLMVGNIYIRAIDENISYDEYLSDHSYLAAGDPDYLLKIEGEAYIEKNHSYTFALSTTDNHVTPYDASRKLLNLILGESWYWPGDSLTYLITVPADGYYFISLKSSQADKKDFPIFKRIAIDGSVPFNEFEAHSFAYTGDGQLANTTLMAGDAPAKIFLTEGEHRLTLTSTADPIFEYYEKLYALMQEINDISLEIRMIAGNKIDKNRDWDILEYVPELDEILLRQADQADEIYAKLRAFTVTEPSTLSSLKVASTRLRNFANDPDSLVNNLTVYSEGSGSISGRLSTLLGEMTWQSMDLDCLYVHGANANLPAPMQGFFQTLGEDIKKLALSFSGNNDISQQRTEEGVLNVWMGRSLYYVEQVRNLVDAEFTPKTGIKVQISAMPDETKLLMAVAANMGPDVVLSGSNYRPFDFALRGALKDLRDFDDFESYIEIFHPETLVPFVINESCYGLPETLNFQMMFYRKDVLEKLGLDIPETWDDVIEMLPTLSRFGMDFGTQLAAAGALKHFGVTIPFIQQFGGQIYSEDGASVALGDPKTIEAFKLMTNLYTQYSLPQTVGSFYASFRYGTMPIGMSDMNTYILLKEAAPELSEQWAMAPSVGVRDENGEIHRYQMATSTATFMFENTQMPDEAWEFMKWWMSTDVQSRFAQNSRLVYGPEFVWNSANLEAFEQSSNYDEEALEAIMVQFESIKEIPRNPAYFSVEREISNAWNKVVLNGVPHRTAIDQAITQCNRVITKKLKEFGYMDQNGNLIKPFVPVDGDTIAGWIEEAKK